MVDPNSPKRDLDAFYKEIENRIAAIAAQLDEIGFDQGKATDRVEGTLTSLHRLVAELEVRLATRLARPIGIEESGPPAEGGVEYREVPGFAGYRVGTDGSVWGSRRAGRGYGRTREWRRLVPYLVRPGPSPTVSLYRDRARHSLRVAEVVLLGFVGPCPEGCEASVVNGDVLDTRLENLRYRPARQFG